jgi:AmiR/NasT family two-component response regulator
VDDLDLSQNQAGTPFVTNVLVIAPPVPDAPDLVADLLEAGMAVAERCTSAEMVRSVVRHAPDVLVCWEPQPGEAFFDAVRLLGTAAPTAILIFSSDVRLESAERALDAGVQSWIVNGYARNRLRSLIQLTQLRYAREKQMREERDELARRFEERKLVDRAKGILMSARQVSEDEAFRLLRTASMQAKQRIGQVSQLVIDAAHYAEAINRAGRLRMLSQRVVKLYALGSAGVEVAGARALLVASVEQVAQIFVHLDKTLSRPTFGDLLEAARGAWLEVQACLEQAATPGAGAPLLSVLSGLDAAAERLLDNADRLTQALEGAGLAPSLHVINTSGRQRMLAQRLAKFALLSATMPAGLPPFVSPFGGCRGRRL